MDDNEPTADITEQVSTIMNAISKQEEIDLLIGQLLSTKYKYDLSPHRKQTALSILQELDCKNIHHISQNISILI